VTVSGCIASGRADKTFTVAGVISRTPELKGQRINVIGTLSDCQVLSCSLHAEGGYRLSIGPSDDFDAAAARFRGQDVVVAATFTGDCVDSPNDGLIVACADRSDTLSNPRMLGLASLFRK
jgi:hypothetical protein